MDAKMAFASVRSACSTDIQRQRGLNPAFPVTGTAGLYHHNSRLPSELPGPAHPKGVFRNHPKPIKTLEVDFPQNFERGRRTRVLRASPTCPRAMTWWRRHWEPLERKRRNSCESTVFAKTPSSGTLRRLATRERTRRDWRMHFRCCRHPS